MRSFWPDRPATLEEVRVLDVASGEKVRSEMGELFSYDLGDDVPSLEEGMPLLDGFVRQEEASRPLRGVTALLIQHQLGSGKR